MSSDAKITLKSLSKTRGKITLLFSDGVALVFGSSDPQAEAFVIERSYDAAYVHALADDLELERADRYLTAKLSRNICSVGQARLSLKKKSFSDKAISGIVERFLRAGFLDDRRFAAEYTRATLNNRPAGRMFLINSLREKRVDAELAEEIVDVALSEVDEVELALTLLRKRWWRLSQMDLESARQKGYTFLSRRSISYASGKAAFERLLAEQEERESESIEAQELSR